MRPTILVIEFCSTLLAISLLTYLFTYFETKYAANNTKIAKIKFGILVTIILNQPSNLSINKLYASDN